MKLTCIIVDDEYLAIKVLQEYAAKIPALQIMNTFTDPRQAVGFARNQAVDLLLLDLQMPFINGLEMIQQLPVPPAVIFTTARHDFAVQAFEQDVLDYLVKPISFARFEKAIQKAIEYAGYRKMAAQQKQETKNFLLLKSDYRVLKLSFTEIMYIEGLSEYVKIYTSETVHTPLAALKGLEQELPPSQFIRIHKSYIVAIGHINTFTNKSVVLLNGRELPVGRSYKDAFMQRMK
jgi:DNA-binding LytR/AlgR family response regulator